MWQRHWTPCTSSLKFVPATEGGTLASPETGLGAPTPPAQDYSPSQVKEKRVLRKDVLGPPTHTHTKGGEAVKADKQRVNGEHT